MPPSKRKFSASQKDVDEASKSMFANVLKRNKTGEPKTPTFNKKIEKKTGEPKTQTFNNKTEKKTGEPKTPTFNKKTEKKKPQSCTGKDSKKAAHETISLSSSSEKGCASRSPSKISMARRSPSRGSVVVVSPEGHPVAGRIEFGSRGEEIEDLTFQGPGAHKKQGKRGAQHRETAATKVKESPAPKAVVVSPPRKAVVASPARKSGKKQTVEAAGLAKQNEDDSSDDELDLLCTPVTGKKQRAKKPSQSPQGLKNPKAAKTSPRKPGTEIAKSTETNSGKCGSVIPNQKSSGVPRARKSDSHPVQASSNSKRKGPDTVAASSPVATKAQKVERDKGAPVVAQGDGDKKNQKQTKSPKSTKMEQFLQDIVQKREVDESRRLQFQEEERKGIEELKKQEDKDSALLELIKRENTAEGRGGSKSSVLGNKKLKPVDWALQKQKFKTRQSREMEEDGEEIDMSDFQRLFIYLRHKLVDLGMDYMKIRENTGDFSNNAVHRLIVDAGLRGEKLDERVMSKLDKVASMFRKARPDLC
mmetsp:Transcript_42477/g.66512  ORF Transcript_42477/g.66512 Transcript_42477/m.66512 type:complete len:532 (-) Transcript_42477:446-2041(-)